MFPKASASALNLYLYATATIFFLALFRKCSLPCHMISSCCVDGPTVGVVNGSPEAQ